MQITTYSALLFALLCANIGFAQNTIFAAPEGQASNPGTIDLPTTIGNAIANMQSGDTIYLRGGTYSLTSTLNIPRGKDGSAEARNALFAYTDEIPVLNFSAQPENSSNRGVILDALFWHVKGIIIEEAGDNGMLLSGNNNILEDCIFRKNHDTGLQLSRYNTNYNSISQWPSDNLILNCEAYDNKDSDNEDADGFAAKLTTGNGNVFKGCVSHHNIDDGWDLYTKTSTGPIGAVTLEDCIAHSNGSLTSGTTSGNGDKNGFKLGGEDIAVDHIVRRCIAFNNGKHGFTFNRNLGTIEISNCTSYNNAERNFSFDGGTSIFKNNLSYMTGSNDRIIGNSSAPNAFENDDDWGFTVTADDFISLTPGVNDDPTLNGFLNLDEESDLVNAGVITEGISYTGAAPDLGAIESGSTANPPAMYSISIAINPLNSGNVSRNPDKQSYAIDEEVTLTANPFSGYEFVNWSGDASGNNASTSITMDEHKSVAAIFIKKEGGGVTPEGPTVRIEDTETPAQGMCSFDGSLKSYPNADNGSAINLSNSSGKAITWKVNVPSSGTYELKWRYVNGGAQTSTNALLLINGVNINGGVSFPKSADKSTFITTAINVDLNKGVNEITLKTSQDSEFADIDWVEITGDNPVAANCDESNSILTGINELKDLSNKFMAYQNYPNPFSSSTRFRFYLNNKGQVSINIYNTLGVKVREVVNATFTIGMHEVNFDRGNLNSGIYLFVIISEEGSFQQQMLIR